MSKDYLAINAGRVILTKVDPLTGALSKDPKDKRICTETCDGITRKKSLDTYEILDGNSNYPAGVYEKGVAYTIGINFTTLNSATLAFLQNSEIKTGEGTMKELTQTSVPMEAPYTLDLLGEIVGDATVLDDENKPLTIVEGEGELKENEFKIDSKKIIFSEADAGKPITLEYVFKVEKVESYDIDENHVNPVVQIEIIYETLSRDKSQRYKNNSTISRAQLTGDIDEDLAKEHKPTVLNFTAIKPAGSKVVMNKKTEIPL